ncbi:Uncharacterised protein [Serratia liquefaciens]|nr:Uncharacterised protein [Serratia liquefaciens]
MIKVQYHRCALLFLWDLSPPPLDVLCVVWYFSNRYQLVHKRILNYFIQVC